MPSPDGPKVYKFRLAGVTGHAAASVVVAFGDFKGGWTKQQMARLAIRLQLAPSCPEPAPKAPRKDTTHAKLVIAARSGSFTWLYDSSKAERAALEETRTSPVRSSVCSGVRRTSNCLIALLKPRTAPVRSSVCSHVCIDTVTPVTIDWPSIYQ